MLGGGLPWGTSTVIVGAAGVGKSTLAGQYATCAAQRGEKAVIYSFDESTRNFTLRSEGVGMPMRSLIADDKINIVQVDPGELAPGQFAQMVRDAVEHHGARVIVIDSLTGYLNATPDERFLLVQLHELLTYLGNKGVCTLLVVAQHGIIGENLQSSVDASYIADTVLLLRYFEHDGIVRKALSALKKRMGMHEPSIHELEIRPGKVRVGAPLQGFRGVLTGIPVYSGSSSDISPWSNRAPKP
jgi:circadian clock protein KaiC